MLHPIKRKPMLKVVEPEKPSKPSKEEKAAKKKNMPSDEYKDLLPPIEMPVDETRKFILSVKRGGEFGLPMIDLRQYQTTELYTGFTKKGLNFSIELIPDLIDYLQKMYEACEEKDLFSEFDEE